MEQVVEDFKRSEEYAAIMTTQYDASYDKGVEEVFFNIWRKRWDINYKILGVELRKLRARWIDEEKDGILDTRPPHSPQYSEVEEDDEVVEVAPSNKVPEQASPSDAREEEEIASNHPLTEDEPTPITLDEATLIPLDESAPANIREEEPAANNADDAPSA